MELVVVDDCAPPATATLDLVVDDGAPAAAALDVVVDDCARVAATLDVVVDEDGSSAAAALDQKDLQPTDNFHNYLVKTAPHLLPRWIGTAVLVLLYALRIYSVRGFYCITYLLSIHIIHLLCIFRSQLARQSSVLPIKGSNKSIKPFIPEFNFWFLTTKAIFLVYFVTFIPMLNVPLCWRVLLIYLAIYFVVQMLYQICLMMGYKYNPYNLFNPWKQIEKEQQQQQQGME